MPSLSTHTDFRRLWFGDTVAQFGTAIGQVVLPLLAIALLHATPFELGVLSAAESAAFLLIGLPAGAWVDRIRRKPLLIRMDLARAALLITLPVAAWLGVLTLSQLVVVALLVGVCTVFFDIGYQSFLPSLVGKEHLVEGNAKLQASHSVARFGGPAAGGAASQVLGAASAITATGFGYLVSAVMLSRIKAEESPPVCAAERNLRREVLEGLRFVLRHRYLRPITAGAAALNLFFGMEGAVLVLFLIRTVELSPGGVGFVLAAAGLGGLIGAAVSSRVNTAIGTARAIWLVPLVASPFGLLIPMARQGWTLTLAVVGLVVVNLAAVTFNIAQVSFRQAVCPDHLLGRMNASVRFAVWGTMPIGALLGGTLASAIGVRETLWVTAAGWVVAPLWLVLSPLRRTRNVPTLEEATTTT